MERDLFHTDHRDFRAMVHEFVANEVEPHLLAWEGRGFGYLMRKLPQERMSVAATSMAAMECTLRSTLEYVGQRNVFGQPVADFQANTFVLAELAAEIQIARVFIDRCVSELVADRLTDVAGAMAKWRITELQQRVVQRCLQLHDGYGFTREYPVARDYPDARGSTLYAGPPRS